MAVSLRSLVQASALTSTLACGGCALPAAAPTATAVEASPNAADADYYIVPLVAPIVRVMGNLRPGGFPAPFHLADYHPNLELKPGDVISITVFEAGGASVFGFYPEASPGKTGVAGKQPFGNLDVSPTGALPPTASPGSAPTSAMPAPMPLPPPKTTTFPPMTVEADGNILIPYVGRMSVGGLTPIEAAERIKGGLSRETLRPQVLVSYVANANNTATVGGEAARPSPVTLTLRGERLLDVIGQAGGSKWPAPDTVIDIVRGRSAARVMLQTVVDYPHENITIRPNDQIFLTHSPRTFTVLGASQKVSQYTFDVPSVSLAEAVGRAGGAIDTIGNPAAVYLFREETSAIASEVLRLAEPFRPAELGPRLEPASPPMIVDRNRIKLVYKINMNDAEGYFLARKIMIRDKDVLLIANAEGAQLLKAFTLVRGVTGAASDLNVFGAGGPLGRSVGSVR